MDQNTALTPQKTCNKRPLETNDIPDSQPAKRPRAPPPVEGYISIPESPGMDLDDSYEEQLDQLASNAPNKTAPHADFNIDDFLLDDSDASLDDLPLINTDINSIIPVLKPSLNQLQGFPPVVAEIMVSWDRDHAALDFFAEQKRLLENRSAPPSDGNPGTQNATRDANTPRAPGDTAESPIVVEKVLTDQVVELVQPTITLYLVSLQKKTAEDAMMEQASIRGHVALTTKNWTTGDETMVEVIFNSETELMYAALKVEISVAQMFDWSDIGYKVEPKAIRLFVNRLQFQKTDNPTFVIIVKGCDIHGLLLEDLVSGSALRCANTQIGQIQTWFVWASSKFNNLMLGLSRNGYLHLKTSPTLLIGKKLYGIDLLKTTKDGETAEKQFMIEIHLDWPQDSYGEVRNLMKKIGLKNAFYENIQPINILRDGSLTRNKGKFKVGVKTKEQKEYLLKNHPKNFKLPYGER